MALSYPWGSGDHKRNIIMNGRCISVNENLESALRSSRLILGNKDFEFNIRLWVDALWIDQDNIAERGREVRRMREIYGDSLGIIVDVGMQSEGSDLAMDLINKIAKNLSSRFNYRSELLKVAFAGETDADTGQFRLALVALFSFFCRPYWSRMWIVQELAMGQDQLVCCGSRCIPLRDVRQALKLLVLEAGILGMIVPENTIPQSDSKEEEAFQGAISVLWWIGRLRESILVSRDEISWTYTQLRSPILSLAQYSSATDPRDKVYGLLGLLPTELVRKIDRGEQNYVLSTEEVFTNFSKAIIEFTGDLDAIYAGTHKREAPPNLSIPSWATDWTVKPGRTSGTDNSLEWYFGCEVDDEVTVVPETTVEAWTTGSSLARSDRHRKGLIKFSNDDRLLTCHGFYIGEIEGVAPELLATSPTEPTSMVFPKERPSPYGGTHETGKALLRTLLLDPLGDQANKSIIFQIPWFGPTADSDAENGTCTFGAEDVKYFTNMREQGWDTTLLGGNFFVFELFRRRNGRFPVGNRPFKDFFPSDIPPAPGKLEATIFDSVSANMMGRRLVTTISGHCGLAPAAVIPGDRVYILFGSSMPVILRLDLETGFYEVVAECYLEGFMKGEAIDGPDAGKYELQEITLH